MATPINSLSKAKQSNSPKAKIINAVVKLRIQEYKTKTRLSLKNSLKLLPHHLQKTVKYDIPKWERSIQLNDILERDTIPINALYIRTQTERLLWHQRLGHPCDKYLYKAHTAINGVPQFKTTTYI